MSDARLILELIDERIEDNNTQMFTGFPATVLEYDNQICTVKPNVRFRYKDGDILELGRLKNVPVKFPSGGGVISSYPIKKGDVVWINCSMVAIDEFLERYQDVLTPSSRRTHSLADATATPCLYTNDKRLGVNNENFETVFHKVDSNGLSQGIISKMIQTPEGDILLESESAETSFKINSDGTTELSDKFGNTIKTTNGKIENVSSGKFTFTNGSEELVSLLQELAALLGNAALTTTKVSGSEVPLTNAASFTAIANRISSLKG